MIKMSIRLNRGSRTFMYEVSNTLWPNVVMGIFDERNGHYADIGELIEY